jgi:hypothetical protein
MGRAEGKEKGECVHGQSTRSASAARGCFLSSASIVRCDVFRLKITIAPLRQQVTGNADGEAAS